LPRIRKDVMVKNRLWWPTLTPCVQKFAEHIELKPTEPNQKYGQLFACQFLRRYSKVRKVSRSTLTGFSHPLLQVFDSPFYPYSPCPFNSHMGPSCFDALSITKSAILLKYFRVRLNLRRTNKTFPSHKYLNQKLMLAIIYWSIIFNYL
jgi:hypothetical protein